MKMKNQRFLMLLASILVFGSMAFAQVPKGNDKSKDAFWALKRVAAAINIANPRAAEQNFKLKFA